LLVVQPSGNSLPCPVNYVLRPDRSRSGRCTIPSAHELHPAGQIRASATRSLHPASHTTGGRCRYAVGNSATRHTVSFFEAWVITPADTADLRAVSKRAVQSSAYRSSDIQFMPCGYSRIKSSTRLKTDPSISSEYSPVLCDKHAPHQRSPPSICRASMQRQNHATRVTGVGYAHQTIAARSSTTWLAYQLSIKFIMRSIVYTPLHGLIPINLL